MKKVEDVQRHSRGEEGRNLGERMSRDRRKSKRIKPAGAEEEKKPARLCEAALFNHTLLLTCIFPDPNSCGDMMRKERGEGKILMNCSSSLWKHVCVT